MATAVERYSMPSEFLLMQENSLIPAVLPAHEPHPSLNRRSTTDIDLPRAASYTYFPQFADVLDTPLSDEIKGSFSIDDLLPDAHDNTSLSSSSDTTLESDGTALEIANRRAERPQLAVLRNELPKLATSNTALKRDAANETPTDSLRSRGNDELSDLPTPSRSLSRFRRRSWMPGSRSPSPANSKRSVDSPADGSAKGFGAGRRSSPFRRSAAVEKEKSEKPRSRSTSLSRRLSTKLRRRPMSTLMDGSAAQNMMPPSPIKSNGLPKSFSTEKIPLPTMTRPVPAAERVPPVPRTESRDKLRLRPEPSRKRDELWTVFRNLDGDIQKFQSKPSALKANVVRAALLPFLRNYQSHPSVHKLRPEDLDRRANILNKWWSGLLELLHNKNNQSVSGTDRPAILDGILGIMERPEWRLAPSPFSPLSERKPKDSESPTTSLSSESSEFLMESVHHNVRNIFTQNLLGQLGFVVEKMSLRNAPASLVSFCGKTCAYAFFFCPGIADVLIRLWNPTMDLLNRVLHECGHKRSANLSDITQAIYSGFPPHLQSIKFTTISATYRALRKPAPLPLGTHHLPWSNPAWVNRWSGKDSDLFYVFVKHYHLLATEFLPTKSTRTERLCAPGLVFVHGQILINMDGTIHRNAAPKDQDPRVGAPNSTFDDILSDPDSAAPTLPIPPTTNATRLMAENRLVMLIRDFLSERSSNPDVTRQIFAQAFADLLKAAARRTSIYDHNACYILCDLLEEAVIILVRYEQINPIQNSFLDWSFWMDVWKQMVQSQNTTTEIRLYALLYSLWVPIAIDPKRKLELCSGFLLEPDFFQSRFNHWCPMVRAYFMRLLCWRVGRYDGEGHIGEADIFESLSERLHQSYAYYLYLRESAQMAPVLMPSTSPCNPAPGRRLLIVRTDSMLNSARNSFISFDGVLSAHPTLKRNPIISDLPQPELRPISNSSSNTSDSDVEAEEKVVKKWGLLRTIIGTSKQEASKSRNSNQANGSQAKSIPRTIPAATNGPQQSQNAQYQRQSYQPAHRAFSFKFSLEWVERLDRRLQTPGPMRIQPPRLPLPAHQFLLSFRPNTITSNSPTTPAFTVGGVSGAFGIDPTGSQGKGIETRGIEPTGEAKSSAKYAGRALAEWALIVGECQSFFDRRRAEGVPANKWVETPSLGVEAFKRPG